MAKLNSSILHPAPPPWTSVFFLEPEQTLCDLWRPATRLDRELITVALVPTFRYYAAMVVGKPIPMPPDGVIDATPEGLRQWMLHGWNKGRFVRPEMVALAWHQHLTDPERAALAHYFRSGEMKPVLAEPLATRAAMDQAPDLWTA